MTSSHDSPGLRRVRRRILRDNYHACGLQTAKDAYLALCMAHMLLGDITLEGLAQRRERAEKQERGPW